MTSEQNVLTLGLASSGKSTFLAALFHGVKDGNEDAFELAELPEERDYLIELEQTWLSLTAMERSRHHDPKKVDLALVDRVTEARFTLSIPDIVGEDFEQAWEHGHFSKSVQTAIGNADGILLFVRADTVREPKLIPLNVTNHSGPSKREPWNAEYSPTQAKLCDLLEQVAELRGGELPPVAVVVTAWDTVRSKKLTPEAWIEWKTPLLNQWIQARDEDAVQFFAISAQGGDVTKPATRKKLASSTSRPIPAGATTLTSPIKWLIESAAE